MKITRTTRAVLKAFLDAGEDGQLYGLQIMKTAHVASGTLYPILDRLENAGWIKGQWDTPEERGRRARRYYTLTDNGVIEATRAVQRTAQQVATAAAE